MHQRRIDINSDIGEGFDDASLMPYLSSCSIACGGHAGDERSMTEAINLARQYDVKVGAHPSFPDKLNFGRVVMDIPEQALLASLILQLQDFVTIAASLRKSVHHVKPHGALYNEACRNRSLAELLIKAVKYVRAADTIYAPWKSELAVVAKRNRLKVKYEAFIDRNYKPDLTLVNRRDANAMIYLPEKALNQVLLLVEKGQVLTEDGQQHRLKATTLCIHSDTTYALPILQHVTRELNKRGILVKP